MNQYYLKNYTNLAVTSDGVFLLQESVDVLVGFSAEQVGVTSIAVQVANGSGRVTCAYANSFLTNNVKEHSKYP